jgi:hypothetical protein
VEESPTRSGLGGQGVYTDTRWWEQIRQRVLREGVTEREVLRETGLHWLTLKKVLEHPEPPGRRRRKPRAEPKVGPYVGRIQEILDADQGMPKKQRQTAQRILERLRNGDLRALYIPCELGLVSDAINFASQADYRFSIFRHDPEWGFRAATAKYYDRHPRFFERRLKTGGIWMAFGDISKVRDFQDFGFAYDEHSATALQFSNDNGIASFSYIEPMTHWLPMAKTYPRTYEGAMQALADSEANGKPAEVGWARLTRRCGDFTHDGRYDLSLQNQAWCDGAVFTLNPDPNIPEDADCPVNKAHWGYSKAWADSNLMQKTGPRMDGIYLDSLPNWGDVRNWRREHWRTVATPLTFDPDTEEPVLLRIFSTWQFAKWVADDVHARGGVMHGNGGALWP